MTDEPAEGLAKLVAGLVERVGELGDAMAERIRSEASDHGGNCVPLEELRESCRVELRNVLRALAGQAPLDPSLGTDTGRRRARQNVPETTLIAGYRSGIRFVWELLIAEATATGLVDHEGLVTAVSSIWAVQDALIESTIAGHREATTELLRNAEQERSALLEALLTNRSLDAATLLAAIGVLRMPRYGRFAVVAAEVTSFGRHPLVRTEQALRGSRIHSVWHLRPDTHVGIVQLATARQYDQLVEILEGEAVSRTGVSPAYEDLYDTGTSLWYAKIAMQGGRAGGCAVTVFDDSLVAVAAAAAPEITQRLARNVFGPLDTLPPAERDVLLDTLETWLACGGSTEETARRMYCHPNTVRQRFRRITEYTGRSTSEPHGITELCIALHALRQNPRQTAETP
ncbi:helix-turn-helix domain-containing protein [Streptomyces sp. NPDC002677]|uniref:PucR family transcriptional regulator n=1 Tax=Streptomyces sp. NPDC002677 TaxID=3154774 RepID=UPI0033232A8E